MLQEQFDSFLNNSQLKSLQVDAAKWQYYVTGTGQTKVLILTGCGSIAEAAFRYINELAKQFTVITPTIPEVNSVRHALAGIEQILKTEQVDKVYVIGFSMGGMLAQCLVREHPQLVEKLVLFVSMLPSKDYARKYTKYKRGISIVPNFIFKALSKYSLRKQVLAEKHIASKEDVGFWLQFFNWEFDSNKMSKGMLLATSDILIDYFSNYCFTPADLQDWTGKLLLIESDQDKTVSKVERERFKSCYAQAELYVQKGSGHFGAGLLKPEESIAVIQEFFTKP